MFFKKVVTLAESLNEMCGLRYSLKNAPIHTAGSSCLETLVLKSEPLRLAAYEEAGKECTRIHMALLAALASASTYDMQFHDKDLEREALTKAILMAGVRPLDPNSGPSRDARSRPDR